MASRNGQFIGEEAEGSLIGKTSYPGHHMFYIWSACVKCGKTRWVAKYDKKRQRTGKCYDCRNRTRGPENPQWQGRWKHTSGYIMVRIQPDDPFYSMSNRGAIFEHRYVMAKHLGRPLLRGEQVHHRPDVAKDDNRIEGLYLMPDPSTHSRLSPCANCELRKQIRLLSWQIKEQSEQIKNLTRRRMFEVPGETIDSDEDD